MGIHSDRWNAPLFRCENSMQKAAKTWSVVPVYKKRVQKLQTHGQMKNLRVSRSVHTHAPRRGQNKSDVCGATSGNSNTSCLNLSPVQPNINMMKVRSSRNFAPRNGENWRFLFPGVERTSVQIVTMDS